MYACNDHIACTPFEKRSAESDVKNGFAQIKQKTALTPLTVVFGDVDGRFCVGDTVYVSGEGYLSFGQKDYEVDGVKFILVPTKQVLLKKNPYDHVQRSFDWITGRNGVPGDTLIGPGVVTTMGGGRIVMSGTPPYIDAPGCGPDHEVK